LAFVWESIALAGPAAGILLAQLMTDEQRPAVRDTLSDLSDHVQGNDLRVRGRPFIVIFGPEYEGELDDYVADGLADIIGWTPKDTLGFAAMCNRQVDHRVLGELCLRFAQLLDGLVDFDGELPASATHGPATLFAVPYEAENGRRCRYHVGNAEFLEWWLKQPDFRMIK
jgi:hypothetical protein